MKKNGFTLIELMGVIILLGLVSIVSYTVITNQIDKNKSDVSDATKKLIYVAVDNYLEDNNNTYPKLEGNNYCISLTDLINGDYISDDAIKNVRDINLNKKIQVSVGSFKKLDYELLNECNIITVTFNPNGGLISQTNKGVALNSTYGYLPTPKKVGYRFLGWYYDNNEITSTTIVVQESDHTLTAMWESIER